MGPRGVAVGLGTALQAAKSRVRFPIVSLEIFFEARHPRCVGSIAKNFCILHNTVEHNYISPSITLGLQLRFSALYVGHLQVVT